MFEVYNLSISHGQQAKNYLHPSEMKIEELQPSKLPFSIEFEKYMNLNKNLNRNETDLYLMEYLEERNW